MKWLQAMNWGKLIQAEEVKPNPITYFSGTDRQH